MWVMRIQYHLCLKTILKRWAKKECCKQYRHDKLKGTMTKWSVHRKKTHITIQKNAEHQGATDILKKKQHLFVFFGRVLQNNVRHALALFHTYVECFIGYTPCRIFKALVVLVPK